MQSNFKKGLFGLGIFTSALFIDLGVAWTMPWRKDTVKLAEQLKTQLHIEEQNPDALVDKAVQQKEGLSKQINHRINAYKQLRQVNLFNRDRLLCVGTSWAVFLIHPQLVAYSMTALASYQSYEIFLSIDSFKKGTVRQESKLEPVQGFYWQLMSLVIIKCALKAGWSYYAARRAGKQLTIKK